MINIYKHYEGLLQISEVHGGQGYRIEFLINGKVKLFEITLMNEFDCGEYNTVYEALDVCEKWT